MTEPAGKREQIIHEASQLFAKFGYRKCTTEDIAYACGLTKAALYHYFRNKEAIFAAVVDKEVSGVMSALRAAVERKSDPVDQLREFILVRFRVITDALNLYRIAFARHQELVPMVAAERERFLVRESAMLEGILQRGEDAGRFRPGPAALLARTLIAGFSGIERRLVLDDDEHDIEAALRHLIDAFLYGVVLGD